MLLPAEMRPFLFHEDPDLRDFALAYFEGAHDPAPFTADDLWAGADRVRGDHHRMAFTRQIATFPSTPGSIARIFDGLRSETHDSILHHLSRALERLPAEEVRRALADPKIARRIAFSDRADLYEVLDLADRSFDDLWRLAETCTVEIKYEAFLLKPTLHWTRRITDALARFPEQAAARALGALLDPPTGRRARWMRAFSARLLGKLRQPAALVPLLALAGDLAPFRWSSDWAEDALVHLGTPEVVAAAAAGFPAGGEFSSHAARILGRIKRPESEQALVHLLAGTLDVGPCTDLGLALCALCTTSPEALERLRVLVTCQQFEPYCGLDRGLLRVCAALGFSPVEAPVWKERMALREASTRTREEQ